MNAAAVAGSIRQVHDAVAHSATGIAGKLYTLVKGTPDGKAFETQFSKPAGMGYDDLYERLEPWTMIGGVSLWRRMLVLGPPPEFCLLSPNEVNLPAEMKPDVFSRELV